MNKKTKDQLSQVDTAFEILMGELVKLDNCVMKYEKENPNKDLDSIVSTMKIADKAQEYIRRIK